MTHDIERYVRDERAGKTYVAVLMKSPLLVSFVDAFFHRYFIKQKNLFYRTFTDDTAAVAWLTDLIADSQTEAD